MLKQISKEGVQARLTDPSLFVFQTINSDDSDKCLMRLEVYPISRFGTPEFIMNAIENENIILMEETGNNIEVPKLNLLGGTYEGMDSRFKR